MNTLNIFYVLLTPRSRLFALSLSLPLSYFSSSRIANSLFSFHSPIYSLSWVEVSWSHSGFTYVSGVQRDYSWPGICPIRNNCNGIGISSCLYKTARLRYSPRQYQTAEDTSCSKRTYSRASYNGPNVGLFVMPPKRQGLFVWLGLGFGPCEY